MVENPVLRPFETHGVDFQGETGDQAVGRCPVCSKDRKFYVNVNTGLWDCKVCGDSGNTRAFLEWKAKHNERDLETKDIVRLAKDRGLPREAFEGIGLGFDGLQYTIPISDESGRICNVRLYQLGKRLYHTKGCSPSLYGANGISEPGPIYVCEGEWDAIALRWLFGKIGKQGVVVAVPGASLFKKDWSGWFRNRSVRVIFDHDSPGEQGEESVRKRLSSARLKRLEFLRWPESLPEGYDVRDYVSKNIKTPRKAWRVLQGLFRETTRIQERDAEHKEKKVGKRKKIRTAEWPEVLDTFNRWLYLPSADAIRTSLAVCLSNRLDGDPVWMFLVAPPGGSKTEIISAMSGAEDTMMVSSLTTHSLISGAVTPGGGDPSLMAELDLLTLLIKDFTCLLTSHDSAVEEIFGTLRDAYDGQCSKRFGTGIHRQYDAHFTILAGCTPAIYEATERHKSLGERFLKHAIGDPLRHAHEDEIIARALRNVNTETQMREELQDVCARFLSRKSQVGLPKVSTEHMLQIQSLAKFGARLRGTVSRDKFRSDLMLNVPTAEIGTRLGKQILKLAMSLSFVDNRDYVNEDDLRIVRKVILDTIPQREERIVRIMYQKCESVDDDMSTLQLSNDSRFPHVTTGRLMQDMEALDVVGRGGAVGRGRSYRYTLRDYVREAIERAGLYETEDDLKRPSLVRVRTREDKRETKPKGTTTGKMLLVRRFRTDPGDD